MEKIDITKTEPTPKEKNLKNTVIDALFYIVQWTWGLPVNIVGGIAYLICTKILKRKHSKFGYANIVYLPWKSGGLSMGLFIFMKDREGVNNWTYNTRIHEYGHTWQCLLLGPLYYIVIALPSVIWCTFFGKFREKHNISYYKLYCEGWANNWGQKASKMEMVDINKG